MTENDKSLPFSLGESSDIECVFGTSVFSIGSPGELLIMMNENGKFVPLEKFQEVFDVLKEVEFGSMCSDCHPFCPSCGFDEPIHKDDCKIKKILEKWEGLS